MSYHLSKLKGVIIALCVLAALGSHLFFAGVDFGVQAVDEDAFQAYVHFAQQMRPGHKAKPQPIQTAQAQPTVWDALDHPRHHTNGSR